MHTIQEMMNSRLSDTTANGFDPNERINRQVDGYNQTEGSREAAAVYDCPKCKNKGNIAFNKDGAFFTAPCECLKIRKTIRTLTKSALGAVDQNTLDNYVISAKWQENIMEKARAFIAAPVGAWFFIGGQVGAGKTHIGKAISYEFIKRGLDVRYMEWKKDVQQLNSIINEPEYLEKFNRFAMPRILYIDDFLKTSRGAAPTQGEINRAIDIIYRRYNQPEAAVIISSEMAAAEICALDEGMGSRIIEKCGEYVINIGHDTQKNYRINKPKEAKR